jgi:hypothetical protein
MLFRGGQYKNGITRWFFQCFQKGVKGRGTQHVHLIYYIHLVPSGLGGKTNLFHQGANIIHTIVGRGIQFMNIQRGAFIKGNAGMTGITGFPIGAGVFAVNGFGQNTGAGGFAHSPRPTKQKSMCQLVVADGIFQCGGDMCLPHHGFKYLRTVLTCRYDKLIHKGCKDNPIRGELSKMRVGKLVLSLHRALLKPLRPFVIHNKEPRNQKTRTNGH